jgi:hypothetical protein
MHTHNFEYIFQPSILNSSDVNRSTNVIPGNKSRKVGWAGHVARMRKKRNEYRDLVGKT